MCVCVCQTLKINSFGSCCYLRLSKAESAQTKGTKIGDNYEELLTDTQKRGLHVLQSELHLAGLTEFIV